jgi:hypothetical protein
MTAGGPRARSRLASPVMALALGGLVALLAVALVALSLITRHNRLAAAGDDVAIAVPFAAVGVFLARRQPGNAIGWLMSGTAICALLTPDAGFYAMLDYRMGHGPRADLLATIGGALEPVHASVRVSQP